MTREEEIGFDTQGTNNINGHDDAHEDAASTRSDGTHNTIDNVLTALKEAQLEVT